MLFSKENRPKIKEENPDITFVSLPSCAWQLLPLGGPAFSLAALATPMLTPSIFLMFQQTLGPNWKEAWWNVACSLRQGEAGVQGPQGLSYYCYCTTRIVGLVLWVGGISYHHHQSVARDLKTAQHNRHYAFWRMICFGKRLGIYMTGVGNEPCICFLSLVFVCIDLLWFDVCDGSEAGATQTIAECDSKWISIGG